MDPFTGVAGAASIAGVAVQSMNALVRDINNIKDAPEVIGELRSELTAVAAVLMTLDEALTESKLDAMMSRPDVKSALQLAIANCQRACDKFDSKLKRWTKHSDNQIHWWDRVRVGLFAETAVEALREQLNTCKSTVSTAVGAATLLTTAAASTTMTDDVKDGLRTREAEISQEITELDVRAAQVEKELQKLAVPPRAENKNDDESSQEDATELLQDQRAALSASRKVLEGLVSESHSIRTGQRISHVDMSHGGKLLVGMINTDGGEREVAQDIQDVKATDRGKGVVGIMKGVDINNFLVD